MPRFPQAQLYFEWDKIPPLLPSPPPAPSKGGHAPNQHSRITTFRDKNAENLSGLQYTSEVVEFLIFLNAPQALIDEFYHAIHVIAVY